MTDLQFEIQEAQAAQDELAAQAELKRRADALPKLQQQLANQQWCEQAGPAADAAEQEAQRILNNAAEAMREWRLKLEALYAEIHTHVAALPGVQAEIAIAAQHARQAASLRQGIVERSGGHVELGINGLPAELGENGFGTLWRRVGGYNEDLLPLPTANRLRYESLVKWAATKPFAPYHPNMYK